MSPIHLCGAILKYTSWSMEISNIKIYQISTLYVPITQTRISILPQLNTLWTGDADLRLYITTVQDG
jgi:hypothetical protein